MMTELISDDITIEPGHGAQGISLLSPRSAVESKLGKPDKESKFTNADDAEDVTWLSYFNLGIDVCVSNSASLVTALSLFRGGISRHRTCDGKTRNDIGPGSTEIEVVERFGTPDESGNGLALRKGQMSRRWVRYDSGIGFEFSSKDNRVDRIAVYPPKQGHARRHQHGE
jgi:hypothetical protein